MTRLAEITAAIATCDRPVALARCVDALLAGDVLPAEILVVDQGADDAVAGVLAGRLASVAQAAPVGESAPGTQSAPAASSSLLEESASPQHSTLGVRVVHLREPRLGLSASRNAAVSAASYPIVAFTDDDCVPDRGWVAAVERALTDRSIAAVAGRVLPLGDERPGTFVVSPRTGTTRIDFRGRAVPWSVGTGGSFAARREWLERIGGFDQRLGAGTPGKAAEDADLIYRLLEAGAAIRFEPDAVVFHERQSAAQRLASRASYGFGIAAFCGLRLRRGDLYAGRLLVSWLLRQCFAFTRAAVRGDGFLLRQRARSIGGAARGFFYGLRVR